MKISLKWVNELVNVETINFEKLVDKLTLGGFEIEEIIEAQIANKKHIVLDIASTANRSDSLSVQGISSEISALLNQPLRDLEYSTMSETWPLSFASQRKPLSKKSDCQVFLAMTIKNIINFTSPEWLKQKLVHSGIVTTNDFRDFQNYIRLETGYPFEFYDLEKIFLKLNGPQDFMLLISCKENIRQIFANNVAIGFAGIVCHEDLECSTETRSILLEGSIFKAAAIRQQSRLAGLRTDRSARYEKSIEDSNIVDACYRLISLLRIKNPDLNCKLHTNSKVKRSNAPTICLNYTTIRDVLGPIKESVSNKCLFVPSHQVTEYLTRLKFKPNYNSALQTWDVTVPDSRREDIESEIDLIEEIGRLYGFDNFLTQLPKIKQIGAEDISYKTRKKITQGFLNMGLAESIHYSLIKPGALKICSVSLINPLVFEYSNLRATLLPSLIQTATTNVKQGNLILDRFEHSHVFSQNSLGLINEKEVVAGIFGSSKVRFNWLVPSRSIDWFEAKGRLEQFFEKLNLIVSWDFCNNIKLVPVLHSYRKSKLLLNKSIELGIFGQINPALARKLNIPLETYLFELDLELIETFSTKTKTIMFKEYSSYPKIVKDLSFISSNEVSFEEIKIILYLNGTRFLTNIQLLDEYSGGSIPNGFKSLCVQFIFQSEKQTLQNKQIEKILENFKLALRKNFDIQIRD